MLVGTPAVCASGLLHPPAHSHLVQVGPAALALTCRRRLHLIGIGRRASDRVLRFAFMSLAALIGFVFRRHSVSGLFSLPKQSLLVHFPLAQYCFRCTLASFLETSSVVLETSSLRSSRSCPPGHLSQLIVDCVHNPREW